MATPLTNFGLVTVGTTYGAADTTIALTTGHGSRLPATTGGYTYPMTWWDSANYAHPADDPNAEIVLVTARSTDTLTVQRAYEGTSASTKNTGGGTYRMSLGVTKGLFEGLRTVKNQHFGLTMSTDFSQTGKNIFVILDDVETIVMDDGTALDNSSGDWSGLYADITASGAGGIDTGTETINTWYEVYAIAKEDGTRSMILHAAKYMQSNASYTSGDDSGQAVGSLTSNAYVAQGFQLGVAGPILFADVKLAKIGSPSSYLLASIYSNNAGKPQTTLVNSGYILQADIPTTASWVRFIFPKDSVSLSAATQYHLVIGSSSVDASNYIQWRMDSSSPGYASGAQNIWDGVSSWTTDSAKDMQFSIVNEVGDSAVTMPTNYTKKCLLGYVYNDSSGNLLHFIQRGRTVRYKEVGTNKLALTATGGLDIAPLDTTVPYLESCTALLGCTGNGSGSAGIMVVGQFDSPAVTIDSGSAATHGGQLVLYSGTTSLRPSGFTDVNVIRASCYIAGTASSKLYVAGYTW